jgi:hypothetical protein
VQYQSAIPKYCGHYESIAEVWTQKHWGYVVLDLKNLYPKLFASAEPDQAENNIGSRSGFGSKSASNIIIGSGSGSL